MKGPSLCLTAVSYSTPGQSRHPPVLGDVGGVGVDERAPPPPPRYGQQRSSHWSPRSSSSGPTKMEADFRSTNLFLALDPPTGGEGRCHQSNDLQPPPPPCPGGRGGATKQ